jgi:hypothetical protein
MGVRVSLGNPGCVTPRRAETLLRQSRVPWAPPGSRNWRRASQAAPAWPRERASGPDVHGHPLCLNVSLRARLQRCVAWDESLVGGARKLDSFGGEK